MDLIMLKDIMKAMLIMFMILVLVWGIIVFIEAIRVYNYNEPKLLVMGIMTDSIYSFDGTSATGYTGFGYMVGVVKKTETNEIIATSMSVLNKHIFTRDKRGKNVEEKKSPTVNFKEEYKNNEYIITNTVEENN